ncbi:hypothetical protein EVAR_13162_1 [Eumeta japonica]|uniref:Uncharacterized protein n=1 Tax=Eumeta variegata TaxID=151549 RepID=A0A4C1U9U6_EUMVA|nr:hypothetical protein EVAR_13162_1 [Eumeta japonica]
MKPIRKGGEYDQNERKNKLRSIRVREVGGGALATGRFHFDMGGFEEKSFLKDRQRTSDSRGVVDSWPAVTIYFPVDRMLVGPL